MWGRLSRALAGGNSAPPHNPPNPKQAPLRPPSAAAEASRAPSPPKSAPSPASSSPNARLLTHAGRTQSIRAWAATLGIDRRTLAYRLNHGWSVDEALGFTPHSRDHAAEQARSAEAQAKVLVVDDDGNTVPRRGAAARLGIKPQSLTHRLRQYRSADGSTVRIPFSLLLDRRNR